MKQELTTIDPAQLDEVAGGFVPVPESIIRRGQWLWNRISGGSSERGSTGGLGGGQPPTGQQP